MPEGGDPRITPTLKRLEDGGDRIELFRTDPSDGNAQFVAVAAGSTSHVVEGKEPTAGQYCFQVPAIRSADPATQRGASARTCAERNG
ncbi:hypothetical protein ACRAKI_24015 [Saccharothrix isguenensis]